MDETVSAEVPEGQTASDYIGELIRGQYETDETENTDSGDAASISVVREDDSGSGEVDISGADPVEGVEDAAEESASDDTEGTSELVTLASLAKHLELEPADLYEVEVPIGEGMTVTLGQLKDDYKEHGPVKEAQVAFKEKTDTWEKQVLQTRSELNSIMSVIPAEMQQQVIQQAKAHQSRWASDQEKMVLEAIPDWADDGKRSVDRTAMVEVAGEFGYSEHDIAHTQDARALRLLYEFSNMKREVQEMKAAAKAKPGKASAPGKATRSNSNQRRLQQLVNKGRQSADPRDKVAAASQLIRQQYGD